MADPYQNNITTLAKRLKPFIMSGAMVAMATQAVKIIVHHYDGAPAEYFDVDDTGWDLAAAACDEKDTMASPPGIFTSDHVVPDDVMYLGAGSLSTIHTGKLTLGAGCYCRDVQLLRTANDANDLDGLVGPASGEGYLNTVNITVTQAGAGNANAILMDAGTIKARSCYVRGITGGAGIATGINCGVGELEVYQCEIFSIATGAGNSYGVYASGGQDDIGYANLYGSLIWATAVSGAQYDLYAIGGEIRHYHCRLPGLTPCHAE